VSAGEIARVALKRGYIKVQGRTPEATMASAMYAPTILLPSSLHLLQAVSPALQKAGNVFTLRRGCNA